MDAWSTEVVGAASRAGTSEGRGREAAVRGMGKPRTEDTNDTITLHLHGNNQLAANAAAAFVNNLDG